MEALLSLCVVDNIQNKGKRQKAFLPSNIRDVECNEASSNNWKRLYVYIMSLMILPLILFFSALVHIKNAQLLKFSRQ